jgi:hypothetical protein
LVWVAQRVSNPVDGQKPQGNDSGQGDHHDAMRGRVCSCPPIWSRHVRVLLEVLKPLPRRAKREDFVNKLGFRMAWVQGIDGVMSRLMNLLPLLSLSHSLPPVGSLP